MKQLALKLKTWGGKRKGAGRRPNAAKADVSHLRRAGFAARHPVHVTMRLLSGVGFLRAFSRARAIEDALRAVKERFGLRVVHYSIQGNHLHLIVECDEPTALSRAIQGLAVRLARALNRLAGRTGKVFSDRFHAHVLKTMREVANVVRYVLENFRYHLREDVAPQGADPCSSAAWLGPVLRTIPPSRRLGHGFCDTVHPQPGHRKEKNAFRLLGQCSTSCPCGQRGLLAGVAARESRQVLSASVRAVQTAS